MEIVDLVQGSVLLSLNIITYLIAESNTWIHSIYLWSWLCIVFYIFVFFGLSENKNLKDTMETIFLLLCIGGNFLVIFPIIIIYVIYTESQTKH